MRLLLFASGTVILATGMLAGRLLENQAALAFLSGALTLGGSLLICGLFSLKMKWHGLIGGGVVALLGVSRGFSNFLQLPEYFLGDRSRGVAPLLESAVAGICLILLVLIVRYLLAERTRRMLAEHR